jgi:hypothetical protein
VITLRHAIEFAVRSNHWHMHVQDPPKAGRFSRYGSTEPKAMHANSVPMAHRPAQAWRRQAPLIIASRALIDQLASINRCTCTYTLDESCKVGIVLLETLQGRLRIVKVAHIRTVDIHHRRVIQIQLTDTRDEWPVSHQLQQLLLRTRMHSKDAFDRREQQRMLLF